MKKGMSDRSRLRIVNPFAVIFPKLKLVLCENTLISLESRGRSPAANMEASLSVIGVVRGDAAGGDGGGVALPTTMLSNSTLVGSPLLPQRSVNLTSVTLLNPVNATGCKVLFCGRLSSTV